MLLKDFIQIIQVVDDVTMLLGKSTSPTIQDVDVLTASIVGRLCQLSDASSSTNIAKELQKDILTRRYCLWNEFPVIGLIIQVSSFLTPQ